MRVLVPAQALDAATLVRLDDFLKIELGMGQMPGQESWGLLDTVLGEMATVVSKEKTVGRSGHRGIRGHRWEEAP